MSEPISFKTTINTTIEEVRAAYTNAVGHGGLWKTLATQRLKPVIGVLDKLEADQKATLCAERAAKAALEAENRAVNQLVAKAYSDLWSAVGRPASDPLFDLLFPSGFAWYADSDVVEQPDRMMILVGLLRTGVHPALDPAVVATTADALEAAASTLRIRVKDAQATADKARHLARMSTSVARVAQMELASLKRFYRAHGQNDAEIHAVLSSQPPRSSRRDLAQLSNFLPK